MPKDSLEVDEIWKEIYQSIIRQVWRLRDAEREKERR